VNPNSQPFGSITRVYWVEWQSHKSCGSVWLTPFPRRDEARGMGIYFTGFIFFPSFPSPILNFISRDSFESFTGMWIIISIFFMILHRVPQYNATLLGYIVSGIHSPTCCTVNNTSVGGLDRAPHHLQGVYATCVRSLQHCCWRLPSPQTSYAAHSSALRCHHCDFDTTALVISSANFSCLKRPTR